MYLGFISSRNVLSILLPLPPTLRWLRDTNEIPDQALLSSTTQSLPPSIITEGNTEVVLTL